MTLGRDKVAEKITVPHATEMIVPVEYMNGLLVAKAVIDPCLDYVPLRVINVSGKEQVL